MDDDDNHIPVQYGGRKGKKMARKTGAKVGGTKKKASTSTKSKGTKRVSSVGGKKKTSATTPRVVKAKPKVKKTAVRRKVAKK